MHTTSRFAFAALLALSSCVGTVEEAEDREASGAEPTTLAAAAVLVNDVPATDLAGARSSLLRFTFTVPDGATLASFTMSGGTGDADLYVRFGAAPTTSSWDYRPYLDGNDETVTIAAPAAGTWHVMIRGYAAYSGVTLVAHHETDATPPPPATDCDADWPADWTAFEDEVLTLVNAHRAAGATCGGVAKPPAGALVMEDALRRAARCHSLDMATQDYFSHTSLDGRSPWDRIDDAGYTAFATGENIAAGQATPAAVVAAWMSSTGHCDNIMNAGSNETGVGYAYDSAATYDRYWTQTFGDR